MNERLKGLSASRNRPAPFGKPTIRQPGYRQSGYRYVAKRLQDSVVAAGLASVTLPASAAVALAIAVRMGRPILFAQERPGRHGQLFRVYKFRTMSESTGADGCQLADSERLTPLGRSLRATSLDELPQLWNVLLGQMSLVGPRPLLVSYLDLYSEDERRRHDVLPGITGLAQINGRNATTWGSRFADDLWYVDHWSLALDVKIMIATVWKVLARSGISYEGHDTMPAFAGHAVAGQAGDGTPTGGESDG